MTREPTEKEKSPSLPWRKGGRHQTHPGSLGKRLKKKRRRRENSFHSIFYGKKARDFPSCLRKRGGGGEQSFAGGTIRQQEGEGEKKEKRERECLSQNVN